jgi:hypothetical protein
MFIFNEDRAMFTKLSGLVVGDVNAPDSGRPVGVKWLDPDIELINLSFPSIIISNTGIVFDSERAANGWFQLPYTPEGFSEWDDLTDFSASPYYAQTPIPYNINYQIEVLSRNNKHATFLTAILSGLDFLHARFGYLEIPEDGTIRRMDLTAGPDRQSIHDRDGKRLFHSVYSVRVSTELLPKEIESYITVNTVVENISILPPAE